MAIQMRRGSNSDFNPSKMLPGEIAVTTDGTRKAYAAFQANDVKELAFKEDMKVTTENIKNALGYTPADEEDVNELNENLAEYITYDLLDISGNVIFEMGAISTTGGKEVDSTTRIRTPFILITPESCLKIKMNKYTKKVRVFWFTTGKQFIESGDWDNSNDYIIITSDKPKYVRIVGANKDDSEVSVSDISVFYNKNIIKDDVNWEYGAIKSSDGTDNNESYNNRIRSNYISVYDYVGVTLKDSGVSFYLFFYDEYKTYISSSGWLNDTVRFKSVIPSGTKFIRIGCKFNTDAEIDVISTCLSKVLINKVVMIDETELNEKSIQLIQKCKEIGLPSNFYIVDYDGVSISDFTDYAEVIKSDGSVEEQLFTKMLKMPKYLAFNIPSGYRLILYVYNKTSSGTYTINKSYNIVETDGIVNCFDSTKNCAITSDGTKYFRYKFYNFNGINGRTLSMIGCDRWNDSDSLGNMYYWGIKANGETSLPDFESYNSIVVPKNRFFALRPTSGNNTLGCMRAFSYDEESDDKYNKRAYASFGFVESSHAIIFRDDSTLLNYDLFVSHDVTSKAIASAKKGVKLGEQLNKFAWMCKKTIEFAGNADTSKTSMMYNAGKTYFGIPYSSRWKDAHFIALEISPETAINAANDEYSIWYDKDVQPLGKGTGYGFVCSAYASLLGGSDYPQTNQGFTWDSNFEMVKSNIPVAGTIYTNAYDEKNNGSHTHCVYVSEILRDGYTLMESVAPLCCKTIHTLQTSDFPSFPSGFKLQLMERTLDEYGWTCNLLHRYGFDSDKHTFTNFDVNVANGSIRPHRGNKSVYGSYDKSENGIGIKITIHDNATTAYMKVPSGEVKSYNVNGRNVIDISNDVTEDGTYELYSNVSPTKEYFRYRVHDDVTVTIEDDGTAIFSHDDVDYCYANNVVGYGKGLEYLGDHNGDVVIANSTKYKACKYKGITVTDVSAAIVYDEWGRYSVNCSIIN